MIIVRIHRVHFRFILGVLFPSSVWRDIRLAFDPVIKPEKWQTARVGPANQFVLCCFHRRVVMEIVGVSTLNPWVSYIIRTASDGSIMEIVVVLTHAYCMLYSLLLVARVPHSSDVNVRWAKAFIATMSELLEYVHSIAFMYVSADPVLKWRCCVRVNLCRYVKTWHPENLAWGNKVLFCNVVSSCLVVREVLFAWNVWSRKWS